MSYPFSEAALKLAPWAKSKADTALNCSYKFNLQYVKKMKKMKRAVSSPAARIGNAAHEALETYLKRKAAGNVQDEASVLRRAIREASIRNGLTTFEIEEVMALAQNIRSFGARFADYHEKFDVKKTLLEHKFGIRADGSATTFFGKVLNEGETDTDGLVKKAIKDVFFRGVWDVGLIIGDPEEPEQVVILDHKSGVPPENKHDMVERFGKQLELYAMSGLALYPSLKGVSTAVHFIQSEEIFWLDRNTPPKIIRDAYIPRYYEFINKAADAAQEARPQRSWLCNFCEYTHVCPLKQ